MINQINATITKDDQETVLAAVATIRGTLPFLIDLTVDKRQAMARLGDKGVAFVWKSIEIGAQNPKILPAGFDLEKLRKDAQLFDDLAPIRLALDQLQRQVRDTAIVAAHDAYASARAIYGYAKTGLGHGSLESAADHLSPHFARKSNGDSAKSERSNDAKS